MGCRIMYDRCAQVSFFVQVWNIASLKCIRTLGGANGHTSAVFALAVCGEPCMLASGSRDHTIRLWELATLEWKRTLHPPHLDCVQVRPPL